MSVLLAREGDLSALTLLWESCFGEDGDYPRRFLALCLAHGRVLIRKAEDTIAAMACYVPMIDRLTDRRGGYLYAVCTHPDHRKKGYCADLMKAAKTMGDFLVLIPARAELYDFYRPMGFDSPLHVPTALAEAAGDLALPDLICDPVFDPMIEEALRFAEQEGYDGPDFAKNQPDFQKIYEICYMKRSICVIMKKSGLFWGDLRADAICGPLPL